MATQPINDGIGQALTRIRAEKPLIHHITNLVTMNDTANLTLCVGALPVMAHAAEEVVEVVQAAAALVLNTGTPTPARIEAMYSAGHQANAQGTPIVLDPVGAGATSWRTANNWRLLAELKIAVLRGNAGEIGALGGAGGAVKGVESVAAPSNPLAVARVMAQQWETVVAITGRRDILSDGRRAWGVDNGHHWLTAITGAGCLATTMIAIFAAVEPDNLLAAAGGLACLGLAAERAAHGTHGPASFKVALFDQLYNLTPEDLAQGARITDLDFGGGR